MLKYILLFYIFFKIGLFSFGGGYAMLRMIYDEIKALGVMSPEELVNITAISQMTPGPIAVNAATYVGFKSAGFLGSFFATLGVSLPSFIIILVISAFFHRFKSSRIVQGILSGIRPATVGMIASTVLLFAQASIFREGFFSRELLKAPFEFIHVPALIIFVLTITLSIKFKIGPIPLTLLAGVLGALML